MKLVHYVCDGPRDHAMVPVLVERWLELPHVAACHSWKDVRLQRGGGYRRKLLYALRRAEQAEADAVVAVVDRDRAGPERLRELEDARAESTLPAAVGEAVPHGEAWLVDDLVPLREVLGWPATDKLPTGSPKAVLDQVCRSAPGGMPAMQAFGELAARVELARCRRASSTGLAAFQADVVSVLGGLAD